MFARGNPGTLSIGRVEAADIARRALEQRGVTLGPKWRVLPSPEDGSAGAHEFIADTAGNERRQQLIGLYLPKQRWVVRVATFEGDVVERAEEWRVYVSDTGQLQRIEHTLPEGRPGASLQEEAARQLARQALVQHTGLDVTRGQAAEISARPSKLKARTDWTFIFADRTVPPLPKGEPRIRVELAGDEIASTGRFIHVPEDWERQQRAADTRNLIVRVVFGLVFGGLLLAAAVTGTIAWSRRRYTPRLFLAAASLMLIISVVSFANGWPAVLARLPTAQPLPLQILGVIGVGLVGLTITSALIGLAIGALPHRLAPAGHISDRDALQLGIAGGLFAAAVSICARWLRTPVWAQTPDVTPLGTFVPFLDVALDPIPGLLTQFAVLLSLLAAITVLTSGWTRRRAPAAAVLLLVGFLGAGTPVGSHVGGWLLAGLLTAAGVLVLYLTLLRADLTIVPIGLGTVTAVATLARGSQRPFSGAFAASTVAAVLVVLVAWWWFRSLRRWRMRVAAAGPITAETTTPA
jgi:hypothetical protein